MTKKQMTWYPPTALQEAIESLGGSDFPLACVLLVLYLDLPVEAQSLLAMSKQFGVVTPDEFKEIVPLWFQASLFSEISTRLLASGSREAADIRFNSVELASRVGGLPVDPEIGNLPLTKEEETRLIFPAYTVDPDVLKSNYR